MFFIEIVDETALFIIYISYTVYELYKIRWETINAKYPKSPPLTEPIQKCFGRV